MIRDRGGVGVVKVTGKPHPAGSEGAAYACAPDGDCGAAVEKALAWARDNGGPAGEIENAGTLPSPVVNITPGSEERAARLWESRRRFTDL